MIHRHFFSRICFCLGFLFFTGILAGQNDFVQERVTLQQCLDKAADHLPVLKQSPVLAAGLQAKLTTWTRQYYPQFTFNGQASYQSDVPSISLPLPGFPGLEIPKAQYRSWIELNQTVYDGGFSSAQKQIEISQNAIQEQMLLVGLKEFRKQIAELYFQVLLLSRQAQLMDRSISLLRDKQKVIESALENGVVQKNDLARIRAEILNLEKKREEVLSAQNAAREILMLLTGWLELETAELTLPDQPGMDAVGMSSAPEIRVLAMQRNSLNSMIGLTRTQRRPRIYAFGQAGIGAPNPYNIFKKDFSNYYIIGIRFGWNIWDWGKSKREVHVAKFQQQLIGLQEEQKRLEISAKVSRLDAEARLAQANISRDREILSLREDIRNTASLQLEEGVITTSQFLEETTARDQAEISLLLDEIIHLKNQYLIRIETGSLSN